MINGVGTAPMLYTLWETSYVEGGLPMTWNNPNGTSDLTWLYQEVTSVTDPTRNTCNDGYNAESTYENKVARIKDLFSNSLTKYKEGTHDTWFMNDLGGYYSYCVKNHWISGSDHNIEVDVKGLTKDLNQLGIDELQNRAENAGLGLIFMNFANRGTTGQECKSDLLLQTIIDNNFKFALRKKPSRNTPAPSYDASYNNGGNAIGWDK